MRIGITLEEERIATGLGIGITHANGEEYNEVDGRTFEDNVRIVMEMDRLTPDSFLELKKDSPGYINFMNRVGVTWDNIRKRLIEIMES